MSRDLDSLVPEFKDLVGVLLANCEDRGFTLVPFFTLRSPIEQAKLWRSSRSGVEVETGINWLRDSGAPWLASVLDEIGPQFAKAESTKAYPGFSWHQWGEAIDCYWLANGKALWDGEGYDVYKAEAAKLGLTQISWERVHVQLRKESHPGKLWSVAEIDRAMKERFSVQDI